MLAQMDCYTNRTRVRRIFLASILGVFLSSVLPTRAHAQIKTPIPLGNAGMCENIFKADECLNPPKDIARAIRSLRWRGVSQAPEVANLGARAVPALLQLAGEKKLSLLVASAHAFALVHWYYPHQDKAEAALLAILNADPTNPVFKRIASGPTTWIQARVWQKLVDEQVAFSVVEAKPLFHSSFLFSGDKYGWPAILKICLRLPPEQAMEAFVDANETFDRANLKNMGDANWKRYDELLDAIGKTDSVYALYYLFQFRRQSSAFAPQPIDQEWYASVFDRGELPPSEANPSSDIERLRGAYDRRIIPLLNKYRVPRSELEINSKYFPQPGPEGTYWRLTRYLINFESPVPGGVNYSTGKLPVPHYHEALTDVLINGKPAIFEDGTEWKNKIASLRWQNPSIYSKKFSLMTVSTTSFSKYESLQVNITDPDGSKYGTGRGMGTIIWQRKISPSDPSETGMGSEARVKDALVWDFHFKLAWERDEPVYITLTVDGAPLKDTEGTVWTRRELHPDKAGQVASTREFTVTWRREPALRHRPQALLNIKRVRPGEGNYRIVGRPHGS